MDKVNERCIICMEKNLADVKDGEYNCVRANCCGSCYCSSCRDNMDKASIETG